MYTHITSNWFNKLSLAALLILSSGATTSLAIASPSAHNRARCNGCHAGGAAATLNAVTIADQCGTCHQPGALTSASASFHTNSRGRCLNCHSFHQPDQVALDSGTEPPVNFATSGNAACRACHGPNGNLASLSPAHRTAATLYHSQARQLQNVSPSQPCLNCHSNQSSSSWRDETDGAVIAFSEHASHPFGIQVVPGAGDSSNWITRNIDPRLPLFDGRIECQTCHLLTADNDDLMIPFPTKYDLCKGCHRHHGDRDSGLIVARVSR